eukprot:15480337-Alexandrium_andersonii.AAC.1
MPAAPEAAASIADGVGGEEVALPVAPAGAGAGSVDAREAPCPTPRTGERGWERPGRLPRPVSRVRSVPALDEGEGEA